MTSKIGGIVVDVDARLAKLEKSLDKGNRDFKKFANQTKRTGKNIERDVGLVSKSFGQLKGVLAGLAVVQGSISLGKFALNFADDLATAADRANIGVEAFQEYKEVFRVLEVDAAGFDKALSRLNGTLGDVQRGVKDEATKALDAMGISARVVSGEIATTDQLLDAIAGSSQTFGTEAEFVSAAVDIFGQRLGGQLAPALYQGTEALNGMKQEARETGAVIDEKFVNKLADANEVVERFSIQARSDFIVFAAETITAFGRASDAVEAFKLSVNSKEVQEPPTLAELYAGGTGKDIFSLQDNAAFFRDSLTGLTSPKPRATIKPKSSGARRVGGGARKGLSEQQKLTQEFEKQTAENEQLLILQTQRYQGFELSAKLQEKITATDEKFAKLGKGKLEILKAQNAQVIIQAQRYEELSNIKDGFDAAEAVGAADIESELEALAKAGLKRAGIVEVTNVRIAKSFQDTANDTLSAIERMTSAVEGGGFLSILQSVIGLGLQLGSVGAFGSDFATKINKPNGLALGTGFASGGLTMVGEQGPELVNMPRGSQVLPNNALKGIGGGGTRIEVNPSPYFDAVVKQLSANVAGPMAVQGALGGAEIAQNNITRRSRNRIR